MKILIGYSMRSGSTLLMHLLGQHPEIRALGDVSSLFYLARAAAGRSPRGAYCVKPPDLVFLHGKHGRWKGFTRRIWLVRDPRDSYLSTVESGYAYLFQRRGRRTAGIDLGLLERWKRIQGCYLRSPENWRLVRYEDLTAAPEETLRSLYTDLKLVFPGIKPFPKYNILHGGDYKIRNTTSVTTQSRGRHEKALTAAQQRVFTEHLGAEMGRYGYEPYF